MRACVIYAFRITYSSHRETWGSRAGRDPGVQRATEERWACQVSRESMASPALRGRRGLWGSRASTDATARTYVKLHPRPVYAFLNDVMSYRELLDPRGCWARRAPGAFPVSWGPGVSKASLHSGVRGRRARRENLGYSGWTAPQVRPVNQDCPA